METQLANTSTPVAARSQVTSRVHLNSGALQSVRWKSANSNDANDSYLVYFNALFRYATVLTRNHAEAEDLVHTIGTRSELAPATPDKDASSPTPYVVAKAEMPTSPEHPSAA